MSAGLTSELREDQVDHRRWAGGFMLALAAHALLVGGLLLGSPQRDTLAEAVPAVVVAFMPAERSAPPKPETIQPEPEIKAVEVSKAQPVVLKHTERKKPKKQRKLPDSKPEPTPELVKNTPEEPVQSIASVAPPLAVPAKFSLPGTADAKPDYLAVLGAWLDKHKEYPRRAQQRGQEGRATLRFVVDRTGHVLSHSIEKGSGYAILDREVEEALRRAQPFPPMPDSLSGSNLSVTVDISFSLHD